MVYYRRYYYFEIVLMLTCPDKAAAGARSLGSVLSLACSVLLLREVRGKFREAMLNENLVGVGLYFARLFFQHFHLCLAKL